MEGQEGPGKSLHFFIEISLEMPSLDFQYLHGRTRTVSQTVACHLERIRQRAQRVLVKQSASLNAILSEAGGCSGARGHVSTQHTTVFPSRWGRGGSLPLSHRGYRSAGLFPLSLSLSLPSQSLYHQAACGWRRRAGSAKERWEGGE